jgi:hypothetical protein
MTHDRATFVASCDKTQRSARRRHQRRGPRAWHRQGCRGGASFNWQAWRYLLDVGVAFGWEPAGTAPPPEYRFGHPDGEIIYPAYDEASKRPWCGSYFTNCYQSVTDADAAALAGALFRALDAVRTRQRLTQEQAAALAGCWDQGVIELATDAAPEAAAAAGALFRDLEAVPKRWQLMREQAAASKDCRPDNLAVVGRADDLAIISELARYAAAGGFDIG